MADPQAPQARADDPGAAVRTLIRSTDRGALSTGLARPVDGLGPGWPYGSLVLVAVDHDLSPLQLLSDLADHSRNLAADDRASLLLDATAGLDDPLTGARVGLLGRIARTDDARLADRYVARHPSAERYRGFADFHLYRMTVLAAHLVAGFGRIHWLPAAALGGGSPAALIAREAAIVEHMNQDHPDALDAYAAGLLGRTGTGWRMTGIDAEGCDLRRGGAVARVPFEQPVDDAEAARAELVRLAQEARRRLGSQV